LFTDKQVNFDVKSLNWSVLQVTDAAVFNRQT